ncbi:DUF4114 domain-containing protein [Spirulina sp. CS-785/01]|uniref:DUF4114 domain-containing protein n=1 Tax=Spirulina sp. CS-785/01 TaxID=3021716 RepID=UPI00232F3583|nr:DUF4114 domain-containing protein [Spirulina sp. CS-785/01]MDB9313850.1 DUF4114 domain-containing protein [Spirulina sp. CS-785/01]
MKFKTFTGFIAVATAAATLFSVTGASAQSISQEKYDQQYENNADQLRLDYEDWKTFNDLINKERKLMDAIDLPKVDLSKLRWEGGVNDVEVYFINEGAGYRNQLFYSTDGGDNKTKIFDDLSSPNSILKNSDGPLSLGEGRDLGDFEGDTFIEFFLKSNGKNGGDHFFGFDSAENPDNFDHLIGYEMDDFVVLGFEDLWNGGDKDYNDTVFAVQGVTTVPEPASVLGILGVGGVMLLRRRNS